MTNTKNNITSPKTKPFPFSEIPPRRFATNPNELSFTGKVELSDDQLNGLVLFEDSIANIVVDGEGTRLVDSLRGGSLDSGEANVITDEQQVPVVFPQYFLSDGYQKDSVAGEQFGTTYDVEEWFAKQALDESNKQTLLALATKSQFYAIESYTNGEDEVYNECTLINIDPVGTISQFRKMINTKQIVHDYRIELIDYLGESEDYNPDRNYAYAQLMILDIYMAKVNSVIASYIPRLVAIIEQSLHEIDGYKELNDAIWEELLPEDIVELIAKNDTWDELYRRMDEVRNGTSASGPVDESLFIAPEQVSQSEGMLSSEEKDKLEKILVEPEVIKEMMQKVLQSVGLSKWVAEQNPGKATFQIIGEERKFYTPTVAATIKRILTVGVHEFMHVVQSENDNSSKLNIAQVKGKRSIGVREAMGKATENEILKMLFGETPKPAATYADAINVILEGGTPSEAANAFASQLSSGDRSIAADRVIRLLRQGFNSQPMVYAEASRMPTALEHIRAGYEEVNGGVTGFDLPDQIRLARIGLLEQGESAIDDIQVLIELIKVFKEDPRYAEAIDWNSIERRVQQNVTS